jgi:stage II sporulation protein AA (anti-sigma F factor antagonist)
MGQEFSLTSETRDNCLIITTSGYINNIGGEAIAKEFSGHFEQGTKKVVINLAQSKVVNSIGMSFLIDIIDRLNEAEGKLVFTNVDPAVEKMLTIMGLFQFAGKEKTVDDALKVLSNEK